MTVYLVNERKGTTREFDDRAAAEEQKDKLIELGMDSQKLKIQAENPFDYTEEINKERRPNEIMDSIEGGVKKAEEKAPVADLPDEQPGVDTDPMDWVPSYFVDHIDGQPAINRKGYDVLAHHYNISVQTEVLVSPTETDYEYAEVVATAETDEGVVYKAHGSAHVDRGDDSYLLLEMADTRAAKRATARATGVGMVAVSELQNEL